MRPALMVAIVSVSGAVVAGCSPPGRSPDPVPQPTASYVLNTIAARDVGERVVLTARVLSVHDPQATVISDADLPKNGLLILGTPASPLRRDDLVTVSGSITRFRYERFDSTHHLSGPQPYVSYENRKVVLADDIRSHN